MPVATTPDGVKISYADLGGSGPPLVMVHATGFHGHIWVPVADRLQGDFHCFSLDLRGHGDSGAPAGLDFGWDGFARDVQSVVDALGLDHPRAVGHSLGGAISLMVEQRAPGTFHSIYAYEPAICVPSQEPGDDGSAEAIDLALRRRSSFPSRREAVANYAGKPPMDSFSDEALAAYVAYGFAERDGHVHLKCRPESEAATFGGFSTTSVYARLPEVRCPVVIACGAEFGSKAAERNDLFASRLPRGRAVELSGLNHFGPQQSPAMLADSIRYALGAEEWAEPCGAHDS
ncbi:MAG TPA: alpha/beta hydrolase [Acidimicrobiales bacterium]